jgi:hypothetical protein
MISSLSHALIITTSNRVESNAIETLMLTGRRTGSLIRPRLLLRCLFSFLFRRESEGGADCFPSNQHSFKADACPRAGANWASCCVVSREPHSLWPRGLLPAAVDEATVVSVQKTSSGVLEETTAQKIRRRHRARTMSQGKKALELVLSTVTLATKGPKNWIWDSLRI